MVNGCSRAWLESEESMVVSSESSDCETVVLKSEKRGRSLVTTESESLVERSSPSQISCPLEQPTTAKREYLETGSLNWLRTDDVREESFSRNGCAPLEASLESEGVGEDGMSERGMAPQRLTLTVILPMGSGIISSRDRLSFGRVGSCHDREFR